MKKKLSVKQLVEYQNSLKKIFTPGPASLAYENIKSLQPCFGRGDPIYEKMENQVLSKLKKMSGHDNIARLQGSASLALEILVLNFFYGKVLIISTGYYSDRLKYICNTAKKIIKKLKKL